MLFLFDNYSKYYLMNSKRVKFKIIKGDKIIAKNKNKKFSLYL